MRATVHSELSSYQLRIAAEGLAPQRMAQDDDALAARRVLRRQKRSAHRRPRAERREEIHRHTRPVHPCGLIAGLQVEAVFAIGGHMFEDTVLAAPIKEGPRRH